MNNYVKQSITITRKQRDTLERFSQVLRQHKLDVSVSSLIRMLIDNGVDSIKFRIMDREFILNDYENKESIGYDL